MDSKILVLFIGMISGFGLSFVGLGLLWIGLPALVQVAFALAFLLASFALAHFSRDPRFAATTMLVGAAPIASLVTQFRDSHDSHLVTASIAASWCLGISAGAYIAARRKS